MMDINVTYSDAEWMSLLGRRLRALRKARRLTQQEAADAAELNRSSVVRAEAGDNPTLLTFVRLLRVYGRIRDLESFLEEPELSPLAVVERMSRKSDG